MGDGILAQYRSIPNLKNWIWKGLLIIIIIIKIHTVGEYRERGNRQTYTQILQLINSISQEACGFTIICVKVMQTLALAYFLCPKTTSRCSFWKLECMQESPKLTQGNYKVLKEHHVFIFSKPAQIFAHKKVSELRNCTQYGRKKNISSTAPENFRLKCIFWWTERCSTFALVYY